MKVGVGMHCTVCGVGMHCTVCGVGMHCTVFVYGRLWYLHATLGDLHGTFRPILMSQTGLGHPRVPERSRAFLDPHILTGSEPSKISKVPKRSKNGRIYTAVCCISHTLHQMAEKLNKMYQRIHTILPSATKPLTPPH